MATADPRAKLLSLLDAIAEVDAKRDLLYAEMRTLLADGEGIGAKLSRLKQAWCDIWTERHKEKCTFDHVKHTAFLKRKLADGFTEEQIIAKMQSYVVSDEAYYVKARHPFGLFVQGFNSWRGIPLEQRPDDSADRLRELRGQ